MTNPTKIYIKEKQSEKVEIPKREGIPEAPIDGKIYGRKDKSWEGILQDTVTETGSNAVNSSGIWTFVQGLITSVQEWVTNNFLTDDSTTDDLGNASDVQGATTSEALNWLKENESPSKFEESGGNIQLIDRKPLDMQGEEIKNSFSKLQTGTTISDYFTLTSTELYKKNIFDNPAEKIITIPDELFNVGTWLYVEIVGAGAPTFTATVGDISEHDLQDRILVFIYRSEDISGNPQYIVI